MYSTDTNFFLKNLPKYYDSPFPNKNSFFNGLSKAIKKEFIEIPILSIPFKEIPVHYHDLSGPFISSDIKNYIEKEIHYGRKYTYLNNEIHYFFKKSPSIFIIQHMIQLIILLKKIFKTENQFQKIIYYETPLKKKFTKNKNKNKNLGPSEVNTGYTNLSHPHKNGCITLYRKEEILKVLIHELIHSNHIDYSIINSKFNNLLWK
jgi:hypothetical protein